MNCNQFRASFPHAPIGSTIHASGSHVEHHLLAAEGDVLKNYLLYLDNARRLIATYMESKRGIQLSDQELTVQMHGIDMAFCLEIANVVVPGDEICFVAILAALLSDRGTAAAAGAAREARAMQQLLRNHKAPYSPRISEAGSLRINQAKAKSKARILAWSAEHAKEHQGLDDPLEALSVLKVAFPTFSRELRLDVSTAAGSAVDALNDPHSDALGLDKMFDVHVAVETAWYKTACVVMETKHTAAMRLGYPIAEAMYTEIGSYLQEAHHCQPYFFTNAFLREAVQNRTCERKWYRKEYDAIYQTYTAKLQKRRHYAAAAAHTVKHAVSLEHTPETIRAVISSNRHNFTDFAENHEHFTPPQISRHSEVAHVGTQLTLEEKRTYADRYEQAHEAHIFGQLW